MIALTLLGGKINKSIVDVIVCLLVAKKKKNKILTLMFMSERITNSARHIDE